jgi:predicted  nucleic acid-binding Zn-ribbon protein/GTPase SAR1 family protein
MTYKVEPSSFLQDLDRVARVRQTVAKHLGAIAQTLVKAEQDGKDSSGKLDLEREIEDLTLASQNLSQGAFRLIVLGDMKRGKSTFLNALIGENLLPSDVNPCTALLTILKYGAEKQVTIHFNNGKPPERVDFAGFKHRYTIDPEEAKSLEQRQQQAFPEVSHAIVEYPLPFLEKGIEIVDSPGLNDTEARNELSLGYLNNCHAVLFVMRASQPCTLAERRYLENYVKERGLSIFFLVNAWDQIKESLIDPDDAEDLAAAEDKLRKLFQANLGDYCKVDGQDFYHERVFEISALQALRRRLKDVNVDLSGTGFPEFLGALNIFLTQERAIAEFRQARTLARQTTTRVHEAIARRIPLLDQDVEQLKQRIASVEPQFTQLNEIRNGFRDDIRSTRDRQARAIADSFRTYVLNLEHTFDQDFQRYQPSEIQFLDFFSESKREQFNLAAQKGFQNYANDKFFAWTALAEKDLNAAFAQLSQSAAKYGASYTNVTQEISEKLIGQKLNPRINIAEEEDNTPTWAKWAMGLFSLARGNLAGAALAATGFDFKSIIINLIATWGITLLFAPILGPFGLILAGLGVGALQANDARKQFAKVIKKELIRHLPQIAQEQWQPIYSAVQECFDAYEKEMIQRIDDDIQSRRGELNNLLQQKQSYEINRDSELNRLNKVETNIAEYCQNIEQAYQSLLV